VTRSVPRVAVSVVAVLGLLVVIALVAARLLYFDGTEEAPPFTLPPPAADPVAPS
jgi:hypothetical protein